MILQKIIFPKEDLCDEKELYYRGDLEKEGETIQFNTYFNSFSIEKWKKYTNLENLKIKLKISGKGKIVVKNSYLENQAIKNEILETKEIDEKEEKIITIPINNLDLKGNINFEIETTNHFKILDGAYETEVSENKKNDVYLGICICTFKREEFVRKNVKRLEEKVLKNNNQIDIFIVDNAHTLDENEFKHENIHYIRNKNVGGSGGFTRGLIESIYRSDKKITHCILMDDDITFEPTAIERNYTFLVLLKKEYEKSMIGGAMFFQDEMYKQATSGEKWENKRIVRKENLDLRKEKNVLFNEVEEEVNFNGWFYCCIPTKVITEDNLPLPIFIHMDDTEYGVRNQNGLILLNGIAVWHPTLVNKGPMTNIYYNVRNMMIMHAKYGKNSKFHMKMYLLVLLLYYTSQYKYSEAEMSLMAYQDFCAGIEEFKKIDGAELHKKLLSLKYPVTDSKIVLEHEMKDVSIIKALCHCALGMISYICPKFLKEKIYTTNVKTVSSVFSKKITMFNVETKKEYSLTRDYKKMKHCFKEYRKICKLINKENDNINEQWKNKWKEITNLEFWNQYLGLN